MKHQTITLLSLVTAVLFASVVLADPPSVQFGGKTYYKVTSTNPALDSGNEVCADVGTVGKTCVGYTEPSDAVCLLFHPGARRTTSTSGDRSGVYCNGPPQTGVCATSFNSCHTCPSCTVSVACNQPIGNLYREMFVECAAVPCDADSDGNVNFRDLLAVLKFLRTGMPLPGNGDCNQDGSVNFRDLLAILQASR